MKELRAEVARLRAYVETIDGDMAAMDHAIEWADDQIRKYLWILSATILTLGRNGRYGLDRAHDMLYPEHQAEGCPWRRPGRRWAAFGSVADLVSLARENGVKVAGNDSREWLIRAMWKAGVLPWFGDKSKATGKAS